MKNSKKLIVMTIALALTLAMATTTTFAWFATGTTATATGISVQAQATDALSISSAVDGTYTGTTTLSGSLTNPAPCTLKGEGDTRYATVTSYTATNPFFKLTATGQTKVDANSGTFNGAVDAIDTMDAVAGTDYIKTSIWLKSSSVGTVTTQYQFSGTKTVDISRAIHITIISGDAVFHVDTNDVGATPTSLGETICSFNAGEITAGTAKEVVIYIWYDGPDSHCDNPGALTAEQLGITFSFTLAPTT